MGYNKLALLIDTIIYIIVFLIKGHFSVIDIENKKIRINLVHILGAFGIINKRVKECKDTINTSFTLGCYWAFYQEDIWPF